MATILIMLCQESGATENTFTLCCAMLRYAALPALHYPTFC